ncbi:YbhB/YbcL family Raf kinase inhibitor-like protein [Segetibacter koreensis]|uniref:YbhB/YbcL family Raf kinase inhibitor-like protein n=1 Tax=Segetibacter koreensis TaxID=398037 RepID=UPI0003666597|nr:YbhB/YbcL family Raf kinase inhibitor-like protein [Segetibacter koreensis]
MIHETKEVDFKLLKITSDEFIDNDFIPAKYTCDGLNISPPLNIEHIPEEAKSLAIIVDDPDAPSGTWVHWVMWNVPVTHHIKENESHGTEGLNDFKQNRYGGPCPPSGTHRYFFKIYALDTILDLPANTKKLELEKAMSEHIIAFGELVGLYKR